MSSYVPLVCPPQAPISVVTAYTSTCLSLMCRRRRRRDRACPTSSDKNIEKIPSNIISSDKKICLTPDPSGSHWGIGSSTWQSNAAHSREPCSLPPGICTPLSPTTKKHHLATTIVLIGVAAVSMLCILGNTSRYPREKQIMLRPNILGGGNTKKVLQVYLVYIMTEENGWRNHFFVSLLVEQ